MDPLKATSPDTAASSTTGESPAGSAAAGSPEGHNRTPVRLCDAPRSQGHSQLPDLGELIQAIFPPKVPPALSTFSRSTPTIVSPEVDETTSALRRLYLASTSLGELGPAVGDKELAPSLQSQGRTNGFFFRANDGSPVQVGLAVSNLLQSLDSIKIPEAITGCLSELIKKLPHYNRVFLDSAAPPTDQSHFRRCFFDEVLLIEAHIPLESTHRHHYLQAFSHFLLAIPHLALKQEDIDFFLAIKGPGFSVPHPRAHALIAALIDATAFEHRGDSTDTSPYSLADSLLNKLIPHYCSLLPEYTDWMNKLFQATTLSKKEEKLLISTRDHKEQSATTNACKGIMNRLHEALASSLEETDGPGSMPPAIKNLLQRIHASDTSRDDREPCSQGAPIAYQILLRRVIGPDLCNSPTVLPSRLKRTAIDLFLRSAQPVQRSNADAGAGADQTQRDTAYLDELITEPTHRKAHLKIARTLLKATTDSGAAAQ